MPYKTNEEEQKLKRESNKWIQPDEMVDTTKLQLKSLTEFAKGLGYDFFYPQSKSFFSNDYYGNKGKEVVSFHTMVKLHNNMYAYHQHKGYYKPPFNFSTYKIRKANAGKIVSVCNLQMDKRTGYIRATSNIVTFEHQEYEKFLDLKYL